MTHPTRTALALLLVCATASLAQETRGKILGHVTDSSSAAVAQAKVSVRNTDTNVNTEVATDAAGYYEAPLLVAGNYQVTVAAPGFRHAERDAIQLTVGAHLEVDVKLEVGGVSDAVTVSAAPPLIDSDTLTSGISIDAKSMMNLPWPGDNPMVLLSLAPGSQTTNTISDYSVRLHSGGPGNVYVAGGVGGNEYSIDGVSNQSGRGMGFSPASELVEAIRVESSGFDASFGHSTGMGVSVMTRSGTNQFHGALRESYDQASWAALDFFTKQTYYNRIAAAHASGNNALADQIASHPALTPFHHNQYAGTIGGPVEIPKLFNGRNKLFFFFGYAGFKINEYRQSYAAFPTSAMRQGDFSSLLPINTTNYQVYDPLSVQPDPTRSGHVVRTPFAGNIVPLSRLTNPVYKFYAGYLPNPNSIPALGVQPNQDFIAYSSPYTELYNSYTNRYDYNMNSNNRIMARWSWNNWRNSNPTWQYYSQSNPSLWQGSGSIRHNVAAGIDWVHNFGSRTVLDVAVGSQIYTGITLDPGFQNTPPSSIGFPSYLDTKSSNAPLLPSINWSGWTGFGPSVAPGVSPKNRILSTKADVSHQTTRHTIKMGVEMRAQYFSAYTAGNNAGVFGFDSTYTQRTDDGFQSAGTGAYGGSWAAFMMGLPSSASADTNASSAAYDSYFGAYVQDNWRFSDRLSLNFGLRMDYEFGGTERYNRLISQFDPTLSLPITAAAQAAYAKVAIPEVPASSFQVLGGATYPGVGDSPRAVWNNAINWQPRLAAAYRLGDKAVIRVGAGIFSDTRNVQTETLNQLGYSWPTSTTFTNNFGQSWLVGSPGAGVSPMSDPFPVLSTGTRFQAPPGNTLGAMAPVGKGFTYAPYDRPHARQYRWRFDYQRQFGASTTVNAGYSGSYSDHISINQSLSAVPAQYYSFDNSRNNTVANNWNTNLTNPFNISNFTGLQSSNPFLYQYLANNSFFTSTTIRKSAIWAPFPQMNGLTETVPLGRAKTEQFDLTATRRFSSGLNLNASFVKLWNLAADYFPNPFDASPAFEPSNLGRPFRLTTSAVYQLPFGKGRRFVNHGLASWIIGGFQLTMLQEYQPGALVAFNSTSYYTGANLTDICNTGPHTLAQWFNTTGFQTNPTLVSTTGQARTFPNYISGYGGCRGDSLKRANAGMARDIKVRESLTLQLRWDVYNVTNHSQFNTPSTSPSAANFGQVTATVAGGGGQGTNNRSMRVMARIVF